jgi:hypothetical protein
MNAQNLVMTCRVLEGHHLAWLAFSMKNPGATVGDVRYGYSADCLGVHAGGDHRGEAGFVRLRTDMAALEDLDAKVWHVLGIPGISEEMINGGKTGRGQPPALTRRFTIMNIPRAPIVLGAPKRAG